MAAISDKNFRTDSYEAFMKKAQETLGNTTKIKKWEISHDFLHGTFRKNFIHASNHSKTFPEFPADDAQYLEMIRQEYKKDMTPAAVDDMRKNNPKLLAQLQFMQMVLSLPITNPVCLNAVRAGRAGQEEESLQLPQKFQQACAEQMLPNSAAFPGKFVPLEQRITVVYAIRGKLDDLITLTYHKVFPAKQQVDAATATLTASTATTSTTATASTASTLTSASNK